MIKRKISKIITITLVLVMLFSTNVFAAEQDTKVSEVEVEELYEIPEHSFTRTFEFRKNVWGEDTIMKVNVLFTIAYSYSDGSWSEVDYADIDVKSVTVNGNPAQVSSVDYKVLTSSAYRIIDVNNKVQIKININVDEYGDVSTYAEMVEREEDNSI